MSGQPGRVVAIIPARGGSVGVPGKNLARVGGVPLIVRAVQAAAAAVSIDEVIVTTDNREIAAAARTAGATVVDRPESLATATASSESAVLHAMENCGHGDITVVVFIQATSPFIAPASLEEAVTRVAAGDEDVVMAAVETHAFLWRLTADGATGVNHDAASRPRRQDRETEYQETGAFYVMDAAGFRAAGHRFFGRVGVEVVAKETGIEIDTPADLELARRLAAGADRRAPITATALVMDFDGVHTDDTALVNEDGSEAVRVSRADGQGVERLRAAGVPMLILSKERNPVVAARGRKLGVPVIQAVDDKEPVLREWCEENGLALESVAYVGNDVGDIGCMEAVGWPIAVADARDDVKRCARVMLDRSGGHGAIREVAERMIASIE